MLSPELIAIRDRLGADRYARRIARQEAQTAKLIHQSQGIFKLERFIPVDAVIARILKLTGFWNRGVRNALHIRVVQQEWTLPGLPPAFDGFRLLQLSDLHVDIHPDLGPAIERVVQSVPHDAAVITGDYRNLTDSCFKPAVRATAGIIAHLAPARFGILGNHDFIEKVPELESAGLPILLNEVSTIRRGGDTVWICGIDDPHFYRTDDLERVARAAPSDAFRILLAHTPAIAEDAARYGFDLMLAGHTHGGQICLPGGQPVVLPTKNLPRRFVLGRWKVGQMQGYTSPGTGSCGVPARFNCPPEVTVHVLRRSRGHY